MIEDLYVIVLDYDFYVNIFDLVGFFCQFIDDFYMVLRFVFLVEKECVVGYLKCLKGYEDKLVIGFFWCFQNFVVVRVCFYLVVNGIVLVIEFCDVIFINFQYRIVDKEVVYLKEKFFDKCYFFDDVDLFNDFLGVVVFMVCCDFVVFVNISVVDMVGILDVLVIWFGQEELLFFLGQDNLFWYLFMIYMYLYKDCVCFEFVLEIIVELDWQLVDWILECCNKCLGLV